MYLLDLYLSKLPQEAFANDIFYLHPLEKTPSDLNVPWYSAVSVGKNTLEKKLSCICEQAGIEGTITNHSLRVTSATHMYMSGVPEKVIQECTGHRSLEALRMYKRSNSQQHEAASSVLMLGGNDDAMLIQVIRWHTDILRRCTPQYLLPHKSHVRTCNLGLL